MDIEGNFVKFNAISSLAVKWKGKTAEELRDSFEFYRDITTGPFEKLGQVTMIVPLTGKYFAEKVTENFVTIWKSFGTYTEVQAKTINKFLEAFENQNFPPGSSIFFTVSPVGSLTISFSKDGSIPEVGNVVIEEGKLGEAILESMIGEQSVAPATKQSLASRLSDIMNQEANA
ncbi:hypothetical protein M8C21_021000 [Ambrosia artemisiifolia]|uniref:Chalcone-flavonone isomerase family protein n=1 Tax=Ambrosia artemisiifolia TaxID=4212 RepID=A0AAD5CRD3_AMBAR|nr:hypothetical protein M8C21_021000 [Ambrosia artemisiifolia]